MAPAGSAGRQSRSQCPRSAPAAVSAPLAHLELLPPLQRPRRGVPLLLGLPRGTAPTLKEQCIPKVAVLSALSSGCACRASKFSRVHTGRDLLRRSHQFTFAGVVGTGKCASFSGLLCARERYHRLLGCPAPPSVYNWNGQRRHHALQARCNASRRTLGNNMWRTCSSLRFNT